MASPIRSIPRTLRLGRILVPKSPISRQAILIPHSHYLGRRSSSSKRPPKVSEYVASQTPPSNPETPPDRMPHQTEEDIATGKALGEPQSEDGLPPEGVPVEEVFKDNPEAMERAPESIKEENSTTAPKDSAEENLTPTGNQEVQGQTGLPSVSEESQAIEEIIRGPGGEKEHSEAVPIEDVVGDGQKPAVMDKTANTDDQSSKVEGATIEEVQDGSEERARNSLLDLFGPTKTNKGRKPKETEATPHFNPLAGQQLDGQDRDLSAWHPPGRLDSQQPNPTTELLSWDVFKTGARKAEKTGNERVVGYSSDPKIREIQRQFNEEIIPKNKPEKKGYPLSLDISIKRDSTPTPFDYFYPPPPPASTLSDYTRHPAAGKGKAYDPFAANIKSPKFPIMYKDDRLVQTCTNHIMRDGKKARAEKVLQQTFMRLIDYFPRRHPVMVLAEAIEKIAPFLKNKAVKNPAGNKITVQPRALFHRQRIRLGFLTMVKAASKKGLRVPFADRLAKEIAAVLQGTAPGLQARHAEHLRATQSRMNLKTPKA